MNDSTKKTFLIDGRLLPCPNKPNCVSSEGPQDKAQVKPLPISGSPANAMKMLEKTLVSIGGRIETSDDSFLHATFRSRVFRFVDDVTCRVDRENGFIHIRSASRLGYSDLGVNRKRVEHIRRLYIEGKGQ